MCISANCSSEIFESQCTLFTHAIQRCMVFTDLFSLLISRIRRPLKSRHASRFVVFSICAPIDRSIDPNPSYTNITTYKLFCTNNSSTTEECRHYFSTALLSELLCKRTEKFLVKLNANCG